MTICAACGEVELYYVLSCGDGAVGDSVVLMFGGAELRALEAENELFQDHIAAIQDAAGDDSIQGAEDTVAAQDHLAQMLNGYIKPDVRVPDKHIVQAYRLRGRRWTFIRSDKMRNHIRSYPLEKRLLEAQQEGGLNTGALLDAFSKIRDDIKDDLQGGISWRGTLYKDNVSGQLSDIWENEFTLWIDAVNESMAYSSGSDYHDLSAGAQLLRGYAGFGLNIGYDPAKNSYGMTANVEARAVLAEAEAQFNGYIPHIEGWKMRPPFAEAAASEAGRQEELNFGYFRGNVTIKANAMLGASLMATAGISYTPQSDGSMEVAPAAAGGGKGEISAGAFAGVEAGGSMRGAIEWRNPGWAPSAGQTLRDNGWKALVSVGVTVAGNLGVGAQADFLITFENGKFMFRAKAQVVWGVGAKGGVSGMIGFSAIIEFAMYTWHQLRDNGFSYLTFISAEAFQALIRATLYAVQYGEDALIALGDGLARLGQWVMEPFENAAAAEQFAMKVKQRPAAVVFGTPEVKGAILYRLSERYTWSWEEHQEGAIVNMMGCIMSRREWEQVVERITPDGSKGSAAAGLLRLNRVLDGGAQQMFDTRLQEILTQGSIQDAIPLGDTRFAGAPVIAGPSYA